MSSRRRARQTALQILFQWDARREPVQDAISAYYESLYAEEPEDRPQPEPFVEQLVKGAVENIAEIDRLISEHAEHWRIERMAAVDRNILRLAVFELRYVGTPAPIVIDESLELAKRFSDQDSAHFINGLLEAIHRTIAGAKAQHRVTSGE